MPAPEGATTICGISAATAVEFKAKIEAAGLQPMYGSPRFTAFTSPMTEDELIQWVVVKPGQFAYPAVTCRHVFKDATGGWMQERKTRCDAELDDCDKLAAEFAELDAQARRAVDTRVGR